MEIGFQSEAIQLLVGLWHSLLISAIGIAAAAVIGVVLGGIRYARIPVAAQLVACYVALFRCTPLLVQIVLIYFALPDIGITLSPFQAACVALSLWGGAYQAEVFRAGFASVPKGEITAARALAMPPLQTFIDIVVPIGLRAAFPAATTTAITQFRSSAFMVVIGYTELTYMATRIVSETFRVFQTFGVVSLMYLVVCLVMSVSARWIERRMAYPGMGAAR